MKETGVGASQEGEWRLRGSRQGRGAEEPHSDGCGGQKGDRLRS